MCAGWPTNVRITDDDVIFVYGLSMLSRGLGYSAFNLFISATSYYRGFLDLPSVALLPRFVKLRQAFKRGCGGFHMALPTKKQLADLATALVREAWRYTDFQIRALFAYFVGAGFCLRTGEIWLIRSDYIDVLKKTVTFPRHLLGNGLKSGPIREFSMGQAQEMLHALFLFNGRNIFVGWGRGPINTYLKEVLNVTLQGARHLGANLNFWRTKDPLAVARALGHHGNEWGQTAFILSVI